jgi:exosortase K
MRLRERLAGSGPVLVFYLVGLCVAFGIKLYYSRAGADDLRWILGPACRLAGLLSGMSFEREGGVGWITRDHRMIVGPACAGLNFLIIAFSALFFSFVHRLRGAPERSAWLGACLAAAGILTVATNSLRIVAAVRLREADLYGRWITPERVHRLEGTLIYCLALLLAYRMAHTVIERLTSAREPRRPPSLLAPLGWYLALTLGVPLLNRAYLRGAGRLLEHSILVLSVCLLLALLAIGLRWIRRRSVPKRPGGGRGGREAAIRGGGVSSLAGC